MSEPKDDALAPMPELPRKVAEGIQGYKRGFISYEYVRQEIENFARSYAEEEVKRERERCAKACEAVAFDGCIEWRREAVNMCIAAIRKV